MQGSWPARNAGAAPGPVRKRGAARYREIFNHDRSMLITMTVRSIRTALRVIGALALLPAFVSAPALAQGIRKPAAKPEAASTGVPGGAKLVASFGDWGAYTAQNGRTKMCYALSEPKNRSPATIKDTKAYLFVSFRPAEKVRNEVASVLNFKTKDKGPGELAIGSTKFDLIPPTSPTPSAPCRRVAP
jgi:hypothetical protein